MNSAITLTGRALYTVPEAMEMLNLSRTVIRPPTDRNSGTPPLGSSFIHDGVHRSSRDRSDGSYECPHAVAAARARFTGTNRGSGGWRPSMSDSAPRASGKGGG
jgi:hypothetical protein